jgi:hypothetical protein
MTIYTMFSTPGTPLSCAADAAATARRGIRMRWAATPQGQQHVFGGAVLENSVVEKPVQTSVETVQRDAVANGQAYLRLTAGLPTIKQFRVPLSLRERSP